MWSQLLVDLRIFAELDEEFRDVNLCPAFGLCPCGNKEGWMLIDAPGLILPRPEQGSCGNEYRPQLFALAHDLKFSLAPIKSFAVESHGLTISQPGLQQ